MSRSPWKPSSVAAPLALGLVLAAAPSCAPDGAAPTLRVQGSSTVRPVAAEAAERLETRTELRVTIDTLGGSAGGIAAVCQGLADVGMSSKPIAQSDRERFPGCAPVEHRIGTDAVAIVVSAAVYEGGVRRLSRKEVRALFEGRVERWSELGGPDLPVFVYDKEPGRGTREVLTRWLYPDAEPPVVDFAHRAEVGGNEEARQKVATHPSAVTPLSAAWAASDDRLQAVALELADGSVVEPTAAAVRERRYPLWRPLLLVTDGPARDAERTFIDFVRGAEGQALLPRHGYLPLAAEAAGAPASSRTGGQVP